MAFVLGIDFLHRQDRNELAGKTEKEEVLDLTASFTEASSDPIIIRPAVAVAIQQQDLQSALEASGLTSLEEEQHVEEEKQRKEIQFVPEKEDKQQGTKTDHKKRRSSRRSKRSSTSSSRHGRKSVLKQNYDLVDMKKFWANRDREKGRRKEHRREQQRQYLRWQQQYSIQIYQRKRQRQRRDKEQLGITAKSRSFGHKSIQKPPVVPPMEEKQRASWSGPSTTTTNTLEENNPYGTVTPLPCHSAHGVLVSTSSQKKEEEKVVVPSDNEGQPPKKSIHEVGKLPVEKLEEPQCDQPSQAVVEEETKEELSKAVEPGVEKPETEEESGTVTPPARETTEKEATPKTNNKKSAEQSPANKTAVVGGIQAPELEKSSREYLPEPAPTTPTEERSPSDVASTIAATPPSPSSRKKALKPWNQPVANYKTSPRRLSKTGIPPPPPTVVQVGMADVETAPPVQSVTQEAEQKPPKEKKVQEVRSALSLVQNFYQKKGFQQASFRSSATLSIGPTIQEDDDDDDDDSSVSSDSSSSSSDSSDEESQPEERPPLALTCQRLVERRSFAGGAQHREEVNTRKDQRMRNSMPSLGTSVRRGGYQTWKKEQRLSSSSTSSSRGDPFEVEC